MLPYIDDFARSLLANNRLTVMSLEAGEVVGLEEVVHLGAEAQAPPYAAHVALSQSGSCGAMQEALERGSQILRGCGRNPGGSAPGRRTARHSPGAAYSAARDGARSSVALYRDIE